MPARRARNGPTRAPFFRCNRVHRSVPAPRPCCKRCNAKKGANVATPRTWYAAPLRVPGNDPNERHPGRRDGPGCGYADGVSSRRERGGFVSWGNASTAPFVPHTGHTPDTPAPGRGSPFRAAASLLRTTYAPSRCTGRRGGTEGEVRTPPQGADGRAPELQKTSLLDDVPGPGWRPREP